MRKFSRKEAAKGIGKVEPEREEARVEGRLARSAQEL